MGKGVLCVGWGGDGIGEEIQNRVWHDGWMDGSLRVIPGFVNFVVKIEGMERDRNDSWVQTDEHDSRDGTWFQSLSFC